MKMSRFLVPTLKEAPSDAVAVSHMLALRAGLIRQEAAGIFSWLPLGIRVLKKIEQIVREEMDRAGAVEVLLPTIQKADLWRKSGRYDDYGAEMLRIKDRHDRDFLFGPTAEEVMTEIVGAHVNSYQQLPLILYNIQWKFRDEVRPRFGVLRSREFLMKDAYSYDLDEAGARESYNRMFVAYLNIFARLGLSVLPVRADPGPIGGDLSHEFMLLAKTGESMVYADERALGLPAPGAPPEDRAELQALVDERLAPYAASDELHDASEYEARVEEGHRMEARGVEVGHIFFFGDKYSRSMGVKLDGPDGQPIALQSGSYGVGVSRLVAAIIEASHDEKGIIWPEAVAPFHVGIVNLAPDKEEVSALANKVYDALEGAGKQCLLDDRKIRAGGKFADMDLIGLPWQVVIGPRSVASGELELKNRASGETIALGFDDLIARLTQGSAGN